MKKLNNMYLWLGVITVASTLAVWISAGLNTVYQNFDGPFYIVVAKTWYNHDLIRNLFSFKLPLEYYPAHFPLYPMMLGLVSLLGLDHLQAMLVVNLVMTVITAGVFYKIAVNLGWESPFWAVFAWLFWWPRMWAVRSVGSPESLFILGIILSLYFFQTKKYFWAGVAGSAAVLTKSPGILLLITYFLILILQFIKEKKINWQAWPVLMIGVTLAGLFYYFQLKTGDFWAYFHTGDNIHLQIFPFRVFDSNQPWVGDFWLEDVIWVYLIAGIGVYRAMKKNQVWGMFGAVFFAVIMFVSHRDISRYSLPLVPVVLLGFSDLLAKKEVKWLLALMVIPLFFYTINFISHNTISIADWRPLL
jgi:Gpi18-like mannosyltransferase